MRRLPKSRRGRVGVAIGLAALLALVVYSVLDEYRPWEQPRYLGQPASWWERQTTRYSLSAGVGAGGEWELRAWSREASEGDRWLPRLGLPRQPAVVLKQPDLPINQGDAAAVLVLIQLVRSREPRARSLAAVALGNVGPGARAAVPALRETAGSVDLVRHLARQALRRIDPEALAAYGRGHPAAGREGGE